MTNVLAPIKAFSDAGDDHSYVAFHCPGCEAQHTIGVGKHAPIVWMWNNSFDKPTLSPSLLITWSSLSPAAQAKQEEFYKIHKRYPTAHELPWDQKNVCHSFVKDGNIEFLTDCTHSLAGQTVPLPPWPYEE